MDVHQSVLPSRTCCRKLVSLQNTPRPYSQAAPSWCLELCVDASAKPFFSTTGFLKLAVCALKLLADRPRHSQSCATLGLPIKSSSSSALSTGVRSALVSPHLFPLVIPFTFHTRRFPQINHSHFWFHLDVCFWRTQTLSEVMNMTMTNLF